MSLLRLLSPLFVVACLYAPSRADEVVLNRGLTIKGRIVEQTTWFVKIDTVISNIRATLQLQRIDIRSITLEPVPDSFFDIPVRPTTKPPASAKKAPSSSPMKPIAKSAPAPPDTKPVELMGRIEQVQGDEVHVLPSEGTSVTVNIASLGWKDKVDIKDGRIVTFTGKTSPFSELFVAASARVPGPKYEFRFERDDNPALGGTAQSWTVMVYVKNTSKQVIKRLDLDVRCFQVSSPNDDHDTATFRDLLPGEVRSEPVTFRFFNYRYIGATSQPDVKVRELKLDW